MSKKTRSIFQINVPTGNLPPSKAKDYISNYAKSMRKAFKKHGDVIVTSYAGEGKVEIIRLI
jgi:hypothetical protein